MSQSSQFAQQLVINFLVCVDDEQYWASIAGSAQGLAHLVHVQWKLPEAHIIPK